MDRKCQKASPVEAAEPVAGATRVRFRERQVLRAADLVAEQDYRVSMRRRHNTGHHIWGIVRGLGLRLTQAGGLSVEAGVAVDGYGRELFVDEQLALPPDAFDRLHSEMLDVWLVYDYEGALTTQRGRRACGPGFSDRRREVSRLRLTRVRPADFVNPAQVVDPRVPAEVPTDDLGFRPHRTPPDDAARVWPVYLGRVARVSAGGTVRYEIPRATRPYAGLRGEMLTAASGRARVQVGSEAAGDARRFAVSVADDAGAFVERLALDREGKTVVRGNTTLGGQLILHENKDAGGPLPPDLPPECRRGAAREEVKGAARAVNFRPLAATPKAAAPWQVYRTSVTKDARSIRQLRFEMGNPGDKGDPALYRLTVGSCDAKDEFHACLSLTADCLVTVAGNLEVRGRVIEAPIKADPSDPRFGAELVNQFVKSAAAVGGIVSSTPADVPVELQLELTVQRQDGDNPPRPLTELETPDGNVRAMVTNEKLVYAINVLNAGENLIAGLLVYESLTFNGATTRRTYPAAPFSLAAGATPRRFPPRPDLSQPADFFIFEPGSVAGDIKLVVTVVGLGAMSNVLTATAEATVRVIVPQG